MTITLENSSLFSGFVEDIPDKTNPFRMVHELIFTPENISTRADSSLLGDIGVVISRDSTIGDINNPYAKPDGFRGQIESIFADITRINGSQSRRLYIKQLSTTKWQLSCI